MVYDISDSMGTHNVTSHSDANLLQIFIQERYSKLSMNNSFCLPIGVLERGCGEVLRTPRSILVKLTNTV